MAPATEERLFSALAFMGIKHTASATPADWAAAAAIASLDLAHETHELLDSIDTRLFELVDPEPPLKRETPGVGVPGESAAGESTLYQDTDTDKLDGQGAVS